MEFLFLLSLATHHHSPLIILSDFQFLSALPLSPVSMVLPLFIYADFRLQSTVETEREGEEERHRRREGERGNLLDKEGKCGVKAMGRGRIVIKKIENPTSRQVTYSKRRLGIMKKAEELTVLCDARVSLVIFSSSGKLADYCSPSTDIKEILKRYQQVTGSDIWNAQYERMQNTLTNLNEINRNLRKEIRQRKGENLEELDIKGLRGLEQNLEEAHGIVRERKFHVIATQTDTYKKKLKSTREMYMALVHELELDDENQQCTFDAEDLSGVYDSSISMVNLQHDEQNRQGLVFEPHGLGSAWSWL